MKHFLWLNATFAGVRESVQSFTSHFFGFSGFGTRTHRHIGWCSVKAGPGGCLDRTPPNMADSVIPKRLPKKACTTTGHQESLILYEYMGQRRQRGMELDEWVGGLDIFRFPDEKLFHQLPSDNL